MEYFFLALFFGLSMAFFAGGLVFSRLVAPHHGCRQRVHVGGRACEPLQRRQAAGVIGVAMGDQDMPEGGRVSAVIADGLNDSLRRCRGAGVDQCQLVAVNQVCVDNAERDEMNSGRDLLRPHRASLSPMRTYRTSSL